LAIKEIGMTYNVIVNENQLDEWVRGNSSIAQGVIVELVWRLVAAASPNPRDRRFPLGDSLGQHGPDGILDAVIGFDPFVPEGKSLWEIGTNNNAGDKATRDYRDLTAAIPAEVRNESTFIFVTPLSARRSGWGHTWKEKAQASWLKERIDFREWRDIRVIDGTKLIDWLHHFQAVELWLAGKMGILVQHVQTPEQRWDILKTIGEPPPLSPKVFLSNRDNACQKLKELFAGITLQLKVGTHYPEQVANFVAAYLASLDGEAKIETLGRCLFVTDYQAWDSVTALSGPLILVADFDFEFADSTAAISLQNARRAGHAVIFGGMPGGIPHPNQVSIPEPREYQLKETLVNAGYQEERARVLAQKSSGNLGSLLRCLQHLSFMPEWGQGTTAAELATAELLGSWREDSEGDRAVAEKLSGKSYGEWIGTMRKVALRPGAPLIQRNNAWKVIARYEAWYTLGSKVFDEHLDRLKDVTVRVLREEDPQFELPPEDRYIASLRSKTLSHSSSLRIGLAETLALLGSHPTALNSCSSGKAELTAALAVREILAGADTNLWASLNQVLPLLAEAAPREFLSNVESALNGTPCPFESLFSQERGGITGRNYLTGLLWALETLAWDAEHLTRVVIILGELAHRDPGGNWANRPINSLTTIFLPWFPQTCAPIPKRKAAITTLLNEFPNIAWKLLLDILPQSHQTSMGTRKPAWREMIPSDWSEGATGKERWEQDTAYAELAISIAKQDVSKLAKLIERLGTLPYPSHVKLLEYLGSETVISMPQEDRVRLWNELTNIVTKHRKYAHADWAIKPPELVDEIAEVANRLTPNSPSYLHQRLFTERDHHLYEENENYAEQEIKLAKKRQAAVQEVFIEGGMEAILRFAQAVESPGRVGLALGAIATKNVDEEILPTLLNSGSVSLAQFAGGFVWSRFWEQKWNWVDQINKSDWSTQQLGQFLAYLPFTSGTWERAANFLAKDQSQYWSRANANPYQSDDDLELAIDFLVEYNRAYDALQCLEMMCHRNQPFDSKRACRVLMAIARSSTNTRSLDPHEVATVIQSLQNNPETSPDDLFQVEWAFLPLLDGYHGASPKLLEQRLADDPAFFCEAIRLVFRSKKEEQQVEQQTEQQANIATNVYRLLHGWKTLPGRQKDGSFVGDGLVSWLETVKAVCTESGHLEVALNTIGQVLIYAPPDPDGLWIHHAAATILNAKDAEKMRSGYVTGLYNSRGVHTVDPTGQAERDIAAIYKMKADEVEARGYHRLAYALKDLAASYIREGAWQASTNLTEEYGG
jgi:hypothetical protein